MQLSTKQLAFRDYLLQKLGFQNDSYLEIYLDNLTKIAGIYYHLVTILDKDWDKNNPKPYYHKTYINPFEPNEGEVWVPEYFSVIDLLMWEFQQKKNLSFKPLNLTNPLLSATDLANFTFCSIGFSISKSFIQIENKLAKKGIEYHEKKLLKIEDRKIFQDKTNRQREDYEQEELAYKNDINGYFFDEFATSELIYSGHSLEEEQKYFINNEKSFVGQPDYIFKNSKGEYFVVEEKFKVLRNSQQVYFADSHKIQLSAYIHYLNEYDLKYGYLIYWIYNRDSRGYTKLENCLVLKIYKTAKTEMFLDSLVAEIKNFTTKKYLDLELDKLNPTKCANCVHTLLCGHKNKKFKQVSFPYSKNYFITYYAPYPDILKKDTVNF